uniref:Rhodanese-related sulfurtransferase n=1 Tax=uncultured Thiotrichaceae bacterium TaxID=298394 RepID=A0A6S6UEL7_9GAMM|nr:MAG: Rhodanese-related sulfurtransferase [uncultured Thiotrichaceae bacterium]
MQTQTPQEIASLLKNAPPHSLQLVDVREPWEYDIVHIEGSLLTPLSQLQQAIETLDTTIPVAVICHHGIRSAHACYFLEKAGFDTINVSGGIDLWARTLDPDMTIY